MDRLPHAAGDEAGEQGDVGIGDVVVSDAAIATVTNVPGTHEIILAEPDVRAVGDRRVTAAPMPGQREADVLIDHVDHRRLQLVGVDVLRVGPAQRLRRRDLGGVTGSLIGTEIAAVSEHGENIALDGLCEFRIGAGWWSEVASIAGPMLNMLENIKEMSLRHPSADFLLEFRQPFGLDACRQFLEVWRSIFVDTQLTVGRKSRVGLGGESRQFGLQGGGKIHAALRYTES